MPALRWFIQGVLPLAVLLGSSPALRADRLPKLAAPSLDAAKLQVEAELAERAGKWDSALELYLKIYVGGKPTPELRDRIRLCLRNVSQNQRHRDPTFQQFVLSLPSAEALTLYTEALTKIQSLYVDRDRATFEKLMTASLDELERALGDAAFRRQHLPEASDAKLMKFIQSIREGWRMKLPANAGEVRRVARDIVMAAQANLALKNPSAIVLELLCGACAGLDESTTYVLPVGPTAELASPILDFAAYGLIVVFDGKGLLVEAVVPNSWAARHTPLRKGDRIERVNDRPMAGANLELLRQALKAQSHPLEHELDVADTDGERPALDKFRLPTPLPTVYGADILKGNIGYLRLSAFKEPTARELDGAIEALKERGMKALILDLRGNPGGSFTAGLAAAQRFLPNGIIATTQGQAAEFRDRVFSSDAGMSAYDLPLILLVDTRTMSSAEVFAAGLKDNRRAILVGLPTFGKGFVQSPIRLESLDDPQNAGKSGFLVLSVASVHTPRGQALNGGGVTPHVTEIDPERQLEIAVTQAIELLNSPILPTMR